MTALCPSELALEAYLLDPERSPIAAHVAGCERCGDRLGRMRLEGQEFAQYVYPATVEAVEAAAHRPPWWRRPAFLLPIPAVAALAAVLVAIFPRSPSDDYVGNKGGTGGLGLTVFVARGAGAEPLIDRAEVPAASALRFRLRASAPCRLRLLSLDEAGAVSPLLPAAGHDGFPVARGETDLPGGVVLDGKAGPERIFALCTPGPFTAEDAEVAVLRATQSRATLRSPAPLSGLPVGASWSSVLLEKRP